MRGMQKREQHPTLCQWHLAWSRHPRAAERAARSGARPRLRYAIAACATGQLTLQETNAHRDVCMRVALQAPPHPNAVGGSGPLSLARASQANAGKRRVTLGVLYDEEARKDLPPVGWCLERARPARAA